MIKRLKFSLLLVAAFTTLAAAQVEAQTITGPIVKGAVYGGGCKANVNGNAVVTITSTLDANDETTEDQGVGSVYGGNDMAGRVYGTTTVNLNGGVVRKNVFGGGNGDYGCTDGDGQVYATNWCETEDVRTYVVPVAWKTTVQVEGSIKVYGSVYGGGNKAGIGLKTDVNDNGATIARANWATTVNLVSGTIGKVYGGGRMAPVYGSINLNFPTTSTIKVGDVFGGNDIANTQAAAEITNGNVVLKGSPVITGNVYGGSNGDYIWEDDGIIKDNEGNEVAHLCGDMVQPDMKKASVLVELTVATDANGDVTGGTVNNVFGGGNKAKILENTEVTMKSGVVTGSIYGGGNLAVVGENNTSGDTPSTKVELQGGSVANAYAGGRAANVQGNATIYTTTDCTNALAVENIYGGNDITGTVTGTSTVKIQGAPDIENVYGGGNGDYNYTSNTDGYIGYTDKPTLAASNVTITLQEGGSVNHAFGGGNAAEVTDGNITINSVATGNPGTINEAYAGGNSATVSNPILTLNASNGSDSKLNVNTIFGGNNLETMNAIPTLTLTKGWAGTVYGGGNKGGMTGNYQVEGDSITGVSTHVSINSADIHIKENIFGGCKAAEITTGTYVELLNGTVGNIFGGNDVAEPVAKTHVHIKGGNVTGDIYGGSKGGYELTEGQNAPTVANTFVLLSNGTIGADDNYVYGGGLAGDAGNTYVKVEGTARIHSTIFGAGCGDFAKIGQCAAHVGNVTTLAKTELLSCDADNTDFDAIYGGGRAGDVENSQLIIEPGFTYVIPTVYGGGYAGDITGTATTTITGVADKAKATTVYGGNDFGGIVNNTVLNLNAGTFANIYGAGNGEYAVGNNNNEYNNISSGANLPGTCKEYVPRSKTITINLDKVANRSNVESDLTVTGNVYGGGNLALVGWDGNDDGTTVTGDEYGSITINVNNGHFMNHIFGGARGREASNEGFGTYLAYGKHQLVFGYKQVNMYNGIIERSLYGGSEAVDDGYPWECVATESTTLRPSSVLNIMGGNIRKNVYGGGYRGNIYGSVYVNVGVNAVDSSYVWTRNYGDATFAANKPELDAHAIILEASIYNGSDWGEAGGKAIFNTRGFWGGESQMLIDGEGYNQTIDPSRPEPAFAINYSLIGAGTSTEGGDVKRSIFIRNFGQTACPGTDDPTQALYSIQRADEVLIDNSALTLLGEQDAYMSYASPEYSFNRIGKLTFRGNSMVNIEDPAIYIGTLRSEKPHRFFNPAEHNDQYLASDLAAATDISSLASCDDNTTLCDKLALQGNKLVMSNGTYVSVLGYTETTDAQGNGTGVNSNTSYGPVEGYMLLLPAQDNTKSYAFARQLTTGDGGFRGGCQSENTLNNTELPYETGDEENVFPYRVWTVGAENGSRFRAIALIANSNTAKPLCYDEQITDAMLPSGYSHGQTSSPFAVAHATLELPPSAPGHYYSVQSVLIDNDNGGQVKLVRGAIEKAYASDNGTWHVSKATDSEESNASILSAALNEIKGNPNYTFGLYFGDGLHFGTDISAAYDANRSVNGAVLVGGNNFANLQGLVTKKIDAGAAEGVIPTLEFDLTYSREFSSTIIRQIELEIMEYEDCPGENNTTVACPVGPVKVVVTLSTIVDKLTDMETKVLAMYNEGQSNTFTKKVVLPATFQPSQLYLTGINWQYTNELNEDNEVVVDNSDNFYLTSSTATLTENNKFGLTAKSNENVTDNIANTLGWYDIPAAAAYDLFTQSGATGNPKNSYNSTFDPIYVGALDGRATASMEFTLHYNGNLVYPTSDELGKAVLHFNSISGNTTTPFTITIHVKSREAGDTIYVASASTLTFTGVPENMSSTFTGLTGTAVTNPATSDDEIGKRPFKYVRTFGDAMSLYQDGDVLCILDQVTLGATDQMTLNGADHWQLQVIRYSGSHKDAPGLANAYKGPMIVLNSGATFSANDVWFNGSGATRTQRALATGESATTFPGIAADGTGRLPAILWANAPVFVAKGDATLSLKRNCLLSNNFNESFTDDNTNYIPGGAIYLEKTDSKVPTLRLGDKTVMKDNLIVAGTTGKNRGAAIYDNGGYIHLGVDGKDGNLFSINNNYSVSSTTATGLFTTETKQVMWPEATSKMTSMNLYKLVPDNTDLRSNIYLTRVKKSPAERNAELEDSQSDVVYFSNTLDKESRIGITKWFPGENCRDTIRIATISNSLLNNVRYNYQNNVFVDDSASAPRPIDLKPVDIFYNYTVSTKDIYFHRCASFKARTLESEREANTYVYTTGDELPAAAPFQFGINVDAQCAATTDTLHFLLQGGFYPYTYNWTCNDVKLVENEKSSSINSEIMHDEALRLSVSQSNWITSNHKDGETYNYTVKGTDLTGCSVEKEFAVKVVRTTDNPYVANPDGFLEQNVSVDNPGVAQNEAGDRFLRVLKGVNLGTEVYPGWNAGKILYYADYIQAPTSNLTQGTTAYEITNADAAATQASRIFCPGDVITLSTIGQDTSNYDFMMWDFDPQLAPEGVMFTIPDRSSTVKAIYKPKTHWYEVVTTIPDTNSYYVDYDGNVTIKNANGLAWLISTMNGLNGQQVLEFHDKTITIDPSVESLDMSAHLWTPLGTINHPFAGRFEGNGKTISGIICMEDQLPAVGFFGAVGHGDTAVVNNLNLEKITVNGNNYVGGITGVLNDGSWITNNTVNGSAMISGSYLVGGIAAQANGVVVVEGNTLENVDFLGNAAYTGALVAEDIETAALSRTICDETQYFGSCLPATTADYTSNVTLKVDGIDTVFKVGQGETLHVEQFEQGNLWGVTLCRTITSTGSSYTNNNVVASTVKMASSGVEGAIANVVTNNGKKGLRKNKSNDATSIYVANNYIQFHTSGNAMLAGGLMGAANNAYLVNNYVYGEVASQGNAGALLGYVGSNVNVDRCYYQEGTSETAFGGGKAAKSLNDVSSFTGRGNQVRLAQRVHGVDNLTRALNNWALAQQRYGDAGINTWRSDLESANNGLPLFGQPDLIAVVDTAMIAVCDSYEWEGQEMTSSAIFTVRLVDSVRYLDSTLVYVYDLHHSEHEFYADSVEAGQGYHGHGFDLSADDLSFPADNQLVHTFQFVDSLLTENGCDSIITLTLTVYSALGIEDGPITADVLFDVNVYPNPTAGMVTVESDQIRSIEVYDAVSRLVTSRNGLETNSVRLDLSAYGTGVYYLRVTTAHGVAIKKVVKK